jgi:hypothetical protein
MSYFRTTVYIKFFLRFGVKNALFKFVEAF